MRIEIDEHSGCCNGVTRAIKQAETFLDSHGVLHSLGAIVHNNTELDRLREKGLRVIGYDDFSTLEGSVVLFRAHGEPPYIYKLAKEHNIQIIDCTCPVVLQLQKKIASTYKSIAPIGGQIVIFGKRGHAEVNGLIGQVEGRAIVVEKVEDIVSLTGNNTIDVSKPIALFSQTTKDPYQYFELGKALKNEIVSQGGDGENLQIFDTICKQVSSRHSNLIEFAKGHSVIIFVCGKESSNGRILSELCRQANRRTYQVEHQSEINPQWLSAEDFVGICGATSTPKWQLEAVAEYLKDLGE